MQEAFEKLRGVDIFSLKSYMEKTEFGSFNGAWVLINELFVNFFFFILNAVVGFFSLLIRVLESVDLYSAYRTTSIRELVKSGMVSLALPMEESQVVP